MWAVLTRAVGKGCREAVSQKKNEAVGGESVWKDESKNGFKQRCFQAALNATCCKTRKSERACGALSIL